MQTNTQEYRRCTRCIMDTTDAAITFDEKGHCNHCTRYLQRASEELFDEETGKTELDRIVAKIKSKKSHKKYDCIVGVSGGVDSTYVAYLCKKQGLTPLAIHFDNGWNAELAVSNIEKTLKVLDIDLYTYVVDWEEFKDLQIAFIKSSIPNLEIPTDHGICSILYQMASKLNIKYIMSGSNVTTEAIMPVHWMGGNQVQYYALIKDIHSQFATKKFKTYPKTSLTEFLYYTFIKNIRIINILNYINYNKRAALEILKAELSYTEYANKHYESIYTRFFQAYILPRKYNMDKRLPHLSTLVASQQIKLPPFKRTLAASSWRGRRGTDIFGNSLSPRMDMKLLVYPAGERSDRGEADPQLICDLFL